MRYAEKSYFILTPRRRDFALDFRTFDFVEGTFALKSKEKQAFLWYFPRLLDKIFTLEQTNSFVFFLLNQIFRTFAINLRG